MDPNKEPNLAPTPEELKAEAEAQLEVKEDELREKLAEEMGLDPDVDSELLDKIVSREKTNREKLSGAIQQKINWRKRAETKTPKEPAKPGDGKPVASDPEEINKVVDAKLQERLDERDLKELNLPEDIETEVKDLAKLKGISVREAAKHPYIITMVENAKKEEAIKNGTPKRSKKGSYSTENIDPSKPLNPADFDFNTTEGVKAWNDAKKAKAEYEKNKNK